MWPLVRDVFCLLFSSVDTVMAVQHSTCSFHRSSYRSFHCPSAALAFHCVNRSSYRSYRRSASTAVCIPSSTCYPCSTSICSALVLPLFSPLHPPLFLYSFLNLCRRYSRRSRSPSLYCTYCTNFALPFFISRNPPFCISCSMWPLVRNVFCLHSSLLTIQS